MLKAITDSIVEICNELNKNDVQYLIVGGIAVALHGYFRWSYTSDGKAAEKYALDIWYNPNYENYFNLLNALENLGQEVSKFKNEKSPNPKSSFFKFGLPTLTLDLLPSLNTLRKFSDSFKNREIITVNSIEISLIHFDDLIKEKESNSRPKDLDDIKKLNEIRNK